MTVVTSWDLFEDLRAAQDEMMRMNGSRSWRPARHYDDSAAAGAWAPAIDISERGDAYMVAADVPGVAAGDVEITFEDGLLTIQGDRHQAREATDAAPSKMHRTERRYGAFRRSITLPSHVAADKIEASAQDGVLVVLVPKAHQAQAMHIKVTGGARRDAITSGTAGSNGSS
jgi:HSP20 family protein